MDLALVLLDWDMAGWTDIVLLTLLIWCFLWVYAGEGRGFA